MSFAHSATALALLLAASAAVPATAANAQQPIAEQSAHPGKGEAPTEDQRLVSFLDSLFDRDLAQNPDRQSYLGVDLGGQDKWTDTSDAEELREIDQAKADLAALTANFDREKLSEDGKLNYDIAAAIFQTKIDSAPFYRLSYVADQFSGQYTDPIVLLQNAHRINTPKDAENYIARLNGIETLMADMVTRLQDRAKIGVIAPAFAFPAMIADITSLLSGAPLDGSTVDHPVYADFKAKVAALDIPEAQKQALISQAAAALQGSFTKGYTGLLAETKRLQALQNKNVGVWALPGGEAFYNMKIKQFTTLDRTADQVHEIGLSEVARIHAEMQQIMDQIGFKGSLQQFFAFIRTDPNNFHENSDAGREAFLAEARAQTARIFAGADQYFHVLPKADLEVRRVEPWRQNSTSIAFYNSPSQDGSRPGIYYANLADMTAVQKYVFRSITFHEGVPGHHFQIARMQELAGLPKIRKFSGQPAYTEGWALYAERLAGEMGMTDEPLYAAGRLQNELWRAVRLVLDTGIHSKKWTREQAIAYFTENTPLAEQDIVTEVERFFVNPGQALSYKTGMNVILALREKAKAALGDAFDIRDFHEAVISAGAMPLPLLERCVNAYIAASQ